jgi:predicted DNA-binding antitoxin AbrB/MazE fold protein
MLQQTVHQVKAVVQDGVLRPLEPLAVPEGREVEVVVRVIPTPEEREEKARRLEEALTRFHEEADKLGPEWWAEFERDINAGRTDWPGPK